MEWDGTSISTEQPVDGYDRNLPEFEAEKLGANQRRRKNQPSIANSHQL
jgi:hypothetical protein